MKPKELIKSIEHYIEKYPDMANNDMNFYTSHRRKTKEGFYHNHEFRSIGMNSLLGKDSLSIGLEK